MAKKKLEQRHIYNLKRDQVDERDYKLSKLEVEEIPDKEDLREECPPIFEQGELGSCHDSITEVLTLEGWKLFNDITYEDKLASVSPTTHEVIFESPTNIIKYHYKGDLIYCSNRVLDFAVTPNHKMLVRRWNEKRRALNSEYEFVEAKDLGWYSGLLNSVIYNGINSPEFYYLPPVENIVKVNRRKGKYVDMVYWVRFIGIYLAEGTMIKENKFDHSKIQIACVKEREKSFIKDV